MKIQRIHESTLEINFKSPSQEFALYWASFLKSDIGKIYTTIPWDDLIKQFRLIEHKKGPARIFNPRGILPLCSSNPMLGVLTGNSLSI